MAGNPMKVRIGVSLGAAGVPSQFGAAVDALEAAGVDSLWLPEMVQAPCMSRRQPGGGLDWVRSVHGIRPTRLAAISVRSAGSQASTVSA